MMTPQERALVYVGLREPARGYVPPTFRDLNQKVRFERQEEENARKNLPAWAYHRDWLNAYALEFMAAVCGGLKLGMAVAMTDHPPRWWPEEQTGGIVAIVARDTYDQSRRPRVSLLCIDRASGYWRNSAGTVQGPDLIALYEHRFSVTTAKAAWQLARVCGLKRPLPW